MKNALVIESTGSTTIHLSLKENHDRKVERTQNLADEEEDREMLTSEQDTPDEHINSNSKLIKMSAWVSERPLKSSL